MAQKNKNQSLEGETMQPNSSKAIQFVDVGEGVAEKVAEKNSQEIMTTWNIQRNKRRT